MRHLTPASDKWAPNCSRYFVFGRVMNNDPRHFCSCRWLLQRASTLRRGFDPCGVEVAHNREDRRCCALYPRQRHRQSFACRDPFDRLPITVWKKSLTVLLPSPPILPGIIIIGIANEIELILMNYCIVNYYATLSLLFSV